MKVTNGSNNKSFQYVSLIWLTKRRLEGMQAVLLERELQAEVHQSKAAQRLTAYNQ